MNKFNKKFPKKTALITLLAVSGLTMSQFTFAANTAGTNIPDNGSNSIVNAIEAAAFAGAKAFYDSMYQYDQNLAATEQANTVTTNKMTLNQAINKEANKSTQDNIDNTLQQLSYAVTPPQAGSDAYQKLQNYQQDNSPVRLSIGTPASDTLYTGPLNQPYEAEELGVTQPTTLYNNYFNFDSLFLPSAYDSKQLTATQRYVQYLTEDYRPITAGLDLSALKNEPPSILKQFINTDAWQSFVLRTRSMLASRSIGLSNLNYLIAERTPIQGLGTAAGMSTQDASPLQVEKYIATHRADNPQWYQEVQKDSSATLLREIATIAAEQEKQNYQAHMDRERILMTLTALEIESAQANQMMAQAETDQVNKAIDGVLHPKTNDNS